MGAPPLSCARFASRPLLRSVVAYAGLPATQSRNVSRHVLPTEPSSAAIDAPPGPAETPRLDFENCCVGLQYRGRGLFNPLDHSLSAARFKSAPACGGYFEGNTQLRRERHLHSPYLPAARCFDSRTIDQG